MTVNDFSNEDAVRAAYDAAEWWLNHAVDTKVIYTISTPSERRMKLAELAVRIVNAVMHSSEEDIAQMFPQLVHGVKGDGIADGSRAAIPKSA